MYGNGRALAAEPCYLLPVGDAVCYLQFVDQEGRMPEPRITLRRASDPPPPGPGRGKRVLVDRGWPPGVRKKDLEVDIWARELAPSAGLGRWFRQRPERWDEFRRRYRGELREAERARLLDELAGLAGQGPLTLLYGARDRTRNQAVLIAEAIEDRLAAG